VKDVTLKPVTPTKTDAPDGLQGNIVPLRDSRDARVAWHWQPTMSGGAILIVPLLAVLALASAATANVLSKRHVRCMTGQRSSRTETGARQPTQRHRTSPCIVRRCRFVSF